MTPVRYLITSAASHADALAAAMLGFALGVCVNAGAASQMRWLLWIAAGH